MNRTETDTGNLASISTSTNGNGERRSATEELQKSNLHEEGGLRGKGVGGGAWEGGRERQPDETE